MSTQQNEFDSKLQVFSIPTQDVIVSALEALQSKLGESEEENQALLRAFLENEPAVIQGLLDFQTIRNLIREEPEQCKIILNIFSANNNQLLLHVLSLTESFGDILVLFEPGNQLEYIFTLLRAHHDRLLKQLIVKSEAIFTILTEWPELREQIYGYLAENNHDLLKKLLKEPATNLLEEFTDHADEIYQVLIENDRELIKELMTESYNTFDLVNVYTPDHLHDLCNDIITSPFLSKICPDFDHTLYLWDQLTEIADRSRLIDAFLGAHPESFIRRDFMNIIDKLLNEHLSVDFCDTLEYCQSMLAKEFYEILKTTKNPALNNEQKKAQILKNAVAARDLKFNSLLLSQGALRYYPFSHFTEEEIQAFHQAILPLLPLTHVLNTKCQVLSIDTKEKIMLNSQEIQALKEQIDVLLTINKHVSQALLSSMREKITQLFGFQKIYNPVIFALISRFAATNHLVDQPAPQAAAGQQPQAHKPLHDGLYSMNTSILVERFIHAAGERYRHDNLVQELDNFCQSKVKEPRESAAAATFSFLAEQSSFSSSTANKRFKK